MGFSTSSKNISLRSIVHQPDGKDITNLCAYCKRDDGQWCYSEITIDWHVGFTITGGGSFWLDSNGITSNRNIENLTLAAEGAVLLCKLDDSWNHKIIPLCLDLIFHNDNGQLVYQIPPKNIRSRLCHVTLNQWTVIKGFAFTRYGTLRATELDLGKHLANEDGMIVRKKNGHFDYTARNWSLDDQWNFWVSLQRINKSWNDDIQCWELMDQWISIDDDGNLIMEDAAGTWDLRGPFFRLLEDIPVIGYIVAGIDEISGDHDEAVRAAAECTYSTIVMGAALVGGALFGPVGAAVASAVAGYAGMYAKAAIGQHIGNPAMRNEVTAITVYRVLTTELFLIAGVGIGEMSVAFSDLLAEELMAEGFDQLVVDMGKWLGKKGLKSMTKEDMKLIVNHLLDAIKHGKSEDDIKHMFNDYQNDGVDLLNS
ncbi:hypothetical protein BGW36DRAFT_374871 [Talaromyces proteolyticus]|uniref:Cyanovirin-N domain-containing protein n=1 Tax=Talaromyces proteolyticus TaxID=1131652 RepID=A0AAD4KZ47_9EURO|nr:uncharacterized protein BGW36DRAFT_374871 [Talaromyces proteolyticus]KAH8700736.1 hypothetical protein BGW36DRAFT_374871 [Talaromyces proteolyticus]